MTIFNSYFDITRGYHLISMTNCHGRHPLTSTWPVLVRLGSHHQQGLAVVVAQVSHAQNAAIGLAEGTPTYPNFPEKVMCGNGIPLNILKRLMILRKYRV